MNEPAALYQALLSRIAADGVAGGDNYVAYSGGVDSALVAHAVHTVFPNNSLAIMALSASVSSDMRRSAENLAEHIGIPLRFVQTFETDDPVYVANEGRSCYICKNGIYEAMKAIRGQLPAGDVRLFNGTNADDLSDPTRVGLVAAREHEVLSPLDTMNKEAVRRVSRHAGLPNWNHAASPCLRSRLHFGVPATDAHLRRIESAEEIVRHTFGIARDSNLRVRHLPGDLAMIEIDADALSTVDPGLCRDALTALGYTDVQIRIFRSGGVASAQNNPDS
jgi:pyridinium-3,5-biscarboxylic acid mononucleotide sulfurtransferase